MDRVNKAAIFGQTFEKAVIEVAARIVAVLGPNHPLLQHEMSPAEVFRQTFGETVGEMAARTAAILGPNHPLLQQGMSPAEAFRKTFGEFLEISIHASMAYSKAEC